MNSIEAKYAPKIVRALTNVHSAHSWTAFDDWLEMSTAAIKMLPTHAKSVVEGNGLAVDDRETADLWARLRERYSEYEMKLYSEAFGYLLQSSSEGFSNTLGIAYEQIGAANKWAGQFFTPWNLASMMAKMTMGDVEKELHERIKRALTHEDNVMGFAVVLSGLIVDREDALEYFYRTVIPAALPYLEPITIIDPAVGSGVMLLAAAENCPSWAIHSGMVEFYGMDIDKTCVDMCKLNLEIHGIGGSLVKSALILSEVELDSLPEPFKAGYKLAQRLEEEEDHEGVRMVEEELRANQQLSMF